VTSDHPTELPLLQVRDLHKHFDVRRGVGWRANGKLRAVDGVSFELAPWETLGVVGESGCGKSTLGRTILRLLEPTSGQIRFNGDDLLSTSRLQLRRLRRDMQMIFQDPVGSLDPRMTVGDLIAEPMLIHRQGSPRRRREAVDELLERVGLRNADAERYPHEFSGGQRQRIGIARAIALKPKLIVCDEPVSALDVSVQAQIINLLDDLQTEFGPAYLFISHNLAVVRHISHRVAVMYLGRIVELAPTDELFDHPSHPYTLALLSAVLEPDAPRKRSGSPKAGEIPSPLNPQPGCAFHPRCPFATEECRAVTPILQHHTGLAVGHIVACHHAERVRTAVETREIT